jgi:hypothetical protein
MVVFSLL